MEIGRRTVPRYVRRGPRADDGLPLRERLCGGDSKDPIGTSHILPFRAAEGRGRHGGTEAARSSHERTLRIQGRGPRATRVAALWPHVCARRVGAAEPTRGDGPGTRALESFRFERGSLLDRRPHEVPPLRPGAVVVPDVRVAEEVLQDEPCVGRPLANPGGGDRAHPAVSPGEACPRQSYIHRYTYTGAWVRRPFPSKIPRT